jgi:hypothetical protein
MWVEWLRARPYGAELGFRAGASPEQIVAAAEALGAQLNNDLRALLSETDGIEGQHGLGVVWPVDRIVRDNLMFRTSTDFAEIYMPFDGMLFFADAGNGDQFALALNTLPRSDVYAWDHENDSRMWVASDLADYFDRWLGGTLKL